MQFTRDFSFSSAGAFRRDWRMAYRFAGKTPVAVYDYQAQRFGGSRQMSFAETHQFSRASSARRFDENGQFVDVPADMPRFTYGLGSQVMRGLVVEPSLQNAQPNNVLSGAALGALSGTGALPQGWDVTGLPDSAVTVEDISPRHGLPSVRVRLAGTPASRVYLFQSSPSAIPATSSETWTVSLWLAHVAGSLNNIGAIVQHVSGWTAGSSYVSGSPFVSADLLPALSSSLGKAQVTDSLRNSETERLRPSLQFLTEGDIDITLDLALPSATTGPEPLIGLISDPASTSVPVVQAADVVAINNLASNTYDVLLRTENQGELILRNQAVTGGQYWPAQAVGDVVQRLCFFPSNSI